MEMRVLSLFFLSAVMAAPSDSWAKMVDTPPVVSMFINNLEKFPGMTDSQSDDAYYMNKSNREAFAASEGGMGGIDIDSERSYNSEIYYLGLGTVANSMRYCNKLYAMLYQEKALKLKHAILDTQEINAPDINGKDELYFYETRLKKTCEYASKTVEVWQSVSVLASTGQIVQIEGYDRMPESWMQIKKDKKSPAKSQKKTQPVSPRPAKSSTPLSEDEYLRLAARYYTAKDYAQATSTLAELTDKYPRNAEAWFRMALIVRYKTKWSKKAFANPSKTAIDYMTKAKDLATGKLKAKAENALYYWEHPNYM